MIWRIDKPTAGVIVAKLLDEFCGGTGRYVVLYKVSSPYEHYEEDFEEIPYGAIERWVSLKEDEVCEDLEKAAADHASAYYDCDNREEFAEVVKVFKAGAQWQKEQIMKDAIGGCIEETQNFDGSIRRFYAASDFLPKNEYKNGDIVKIIIVKDNE